MIDKERHCRSIGYGAMLLEGLVGITALIAACVMPPEDYVAINTDPKIAVVASADTKSAGLARSVEQLGRADRALTAHDRKLLDLEAGESITTLAGAKLPASKLLALSNPALAALDYEVDHTGAYSYLPASVGTFPPPAEFVTMLQQAGFSQVRADPLTFGIVYLYTAVKAP